MKTKSATTGNWTLIIVLALLAAIGAALYFFFRKRQADTELAASSLQSEAVAAVAESVGVDSNNAVIASSGASSTGAATVNMSSGASSSNVTIAPKQGVPITGGGFGTAPVSGFNSQVIALLGG